MRKDYSLLIVIALVLALLFTPIGAPIASLVADIVEDFPEKLKELTDHSNNEPEEEEKLENNDTGSAEEPEEDENDGTEEVDPEEPDTDDVPADSEEEAPEEENPEEEIPADPAPQYEYSYYTGIDAAITDAVGAELGANADATEDLAAVKAYRDENGDFIVVLLSDISLADTLSVAGDVVVDLNGKKITSTGVSALSVTGGNVKLVATESGSGIIVSEGDGVSAISQSGGILSILGGEYAVENATGGISLKTTGGSLDVYGANVRVSGTGTSYGIAVQDGAVLSADSITVSAKGTATTYGVYAKGTVAINSSDIQALSDGAKSRALYLAASAVGTVSDSSMKGLCTLYQATGTSSSQGVSNSGSLTLNNCYAWGSHVGISNAGALVVNGGIYESPGHGGIYFGNISAPAYVADATLRYCAPPENSDASADYNNCGFYIGGGSDRNNVVVYMDNCEIYGDSWAFTLRGSSGEQNNTLYISNSTISGNGYVRLDNRTHTLYIGAGNNFEAGGVKDVNGNVMADYVISTDEIYRYNEGV